MKILKALKLLLKASHAKSNVVNYVTTIFCMVKKEEKNLEATLLIEPNNEEAMLMLMKIALEKSNYSKVKSLSEDFVKVCKNLCDENKEILETLKNIEPKNNDS